jgi:hypothetical protein
MLLLGYETLRLAAHPNGAVHIRLEDRHTFLAYHGGGFEEKRARERTQ